MSAFEVNVGPLKVCVCRQHAVFHASLVLLLCCLNVTFLCAINIHCFPKTCIARRHVILLCSLLVKITLQLLLCQTHSSEPNMYKCIRESNY